MARDLLMSQTPRAGVRPVEIKDITTFVQRVFGTYVPEVGGALSSRRDGFLLIQALPQAAALSPSRCFSPRRTDTMVGRTRCRRYVDRVVVDSREFSCGCPAN